MKMTAPRLLWTALPIAAGLVMSTARLAGADVMIATKTDDTLFVHRVSGDGVEKLFEERGKGAYAYAWSNARTLWVLRKDQAGFVLGKVIDGKADPTTTPLIGLAAATPGKEVPDGIDTSPGLIATRSGQIYVAPCIGQEPVPGARGLMRCKRAYLRADDGSFAQAAKFPRGVTFQWDRSRPPAMPVLKKLPKGYKVAITRTKVKGSSYTGFACTAPGGKKKWPTAADELMEPRFTPKVNKATWLATKPPIVHIEANGKSPVGEKLYQEWYLADCTTAFEAVRPLRDGLWMADDEIRKASGQVLGKLPGGTPVIAP